MESSQFYQPSAVAAAAQRSFTERQLERLSRTELVKRASDLTERTHLFLLEDASLDDDEQWGYDARHAHSE